jgi:PilZ domain.
MSKENRKLLRYRTLRSAQLVNSETGQYLDCRVLDLNSQGAKIRLRGRMPDSLGKVEFLLLPENVKVPGIARWLHGMDCGIQFIKPVRFLERHDVNPAERQAVQNDSAA